MQSILFKVIAKIISGVHPYCGPRCISGKMPFGYSSQNERLRVLLANQFHAAN